jgi:hypothetical protein
VCTVWSGPAIRTSTVHSAKPWDDTAVVELVPAFRNSIELIVWYPLKAYRAIVIVVISPPCVRSGFLVMSVHLVSELDFLSVIMYFPTGSKRNI